MESTVVTPRANMLYGDSQRVGRRVYFIIYKNGKFVNDKKYNEMSSFIAPKSKGLSVNDIIRKRHEYASNIDENAEDKIAKSSSNWLKPNANINKSKNVHNVMNYKANSGIETFNQYDVLNKLGSNNVVSLNKFDINPPIVISSVQNVV